MSANSYETRSQTLCSSTGSAAARARAKVEAAKTRLAFTQKEVNLKLEKAQIEASLELLQCEKEAAKAAAEAEISEAAVQSQIDGQCSGHDSDLPSIESSLWTESYVLAQAKLVENVTTEMHKEPSSLN